MAVGVGAFASPRSKLSPKGPEVALIPSAGDLVGIEAGAAAGAGTEGETSVDLEGSVDDGTGFSAEAVER